MASKSGSRRSQRRGREIESGTYDAYTRSGVIASENGEYHIEFCETDNEHGLENFALIYGKMVRTADQTVVAVINAQLLKRSSRGGLYAVADDESDELIQFVRFFCNDNGQLRKGLREAIEDPARVKAAGRGGLLFLDEVHVLRSCRGQDFSLELVHAMLRHLGDRWSLCGTYLVPYGFEDQYDTAQQEGDERTTTSARASAATARLGLTQVSDSYWFLERRSCHLHHWREGGGRSRGDAACSTAQARARAVGAGREAEESGRGCELHRRNDGGLTLRRSSKEP